MFQNFDYRPYFGASGALLQNLRDFVEKDGHAIVMVGEDQSFSKGACEGGWPMSCPWASRGTPSTPTRVSSMPQAAGSAGTRLISDPDERTLVVSPSHGRWNQPGAERAARSWLLEHPTLKTPDGDALPVLAVREVGKGRTMSLSVDSSWRWSLSEAAVGRGNQAYLRFWKGAMRWLVGDPTTRRVTAETNRENYALGEEIRLVVTARGADFAPLPGADVKVEVSVDGQTEQLEARGAKVRRCFASRQPGVVRVTPAGDRWRCATKRSGQRV